MESVAFFSAQSFAQRPLQKACEGLFAPIWIDSSLSASTVAEATGCRIVNLFVEDVADRTVLKGLKDLGVGLIALRCTGHDRVDLRAAAELGIAVSYVPAYSPCSVAEFALMLILALLRKLPQSEQRVHRHDFSLSGLEGSCLHGRTVGLIGCGHIGQSLAHLLKAFQCDILVYDPYLSRWSAPGQLCSLQEVLSRSDILSVHCPLNAQTRYLLNRDTLAQLKPGAYLINTARGAILDTKAALELVKSGRIAGLGLDVFEREAGLFFHDQSQAAAIDPELQQLLQQPNVIITAHEAFLTHEALGEIAQTTVDSMKAFVEGRTIPHQLRFESI
jgi:D-lactate dehydrogenase